MVESNEGGIMSKELAVQNDLGLMGTSDAFFKSGYFPDVKSAAQAAIKIMAGQEIGVGPFASMRGIVLNHGKLELSAGLVGSLIKTSGTYNYRIVTHTNTACVLAFYEQGNEVGKSGFTIDDARKAGLTTGTNKHSWDHYPRNMLFSRALTNGARWYCPDIFSGSIYTPDELGTPIDGDTGEVIDAEEIVERTPTHAYPDVNDTQDSDWDGETFDAGEEEDAAPEMPPTDAKLAKMHERWDTRYAEAKALGINVSAIDWSISYDDLKARGIALAEAIAQRQADLKAAED